MHLGVTGPRSLTTEQQQQAYFDLWELDHRNPNAHWHVGDALGLDALAREVATGLQHRYDAASREPWELQRRSKRMVDALAVGGGVLHAWPNKPCPAGITPDSWKGSGTWGTVRYAVSRGVAVELHWLVEECLLPEWMEQTQMSLL